MLTPVISIAFAIVVLCYGVSAYFYVRVLSSEEDRQELPRAQWLRSIGLAVHVLYLVLLGFKYGELPLVSLSNVMSHLALAMVLVHSIVELRAKVRGSGAFVVSVACLLQLLGVSAITDTPEVQDFLRSPLFGAHVLLAIAGYTGLTLSALYGVMYLIQFSALKSHRFGPFFKNLPALDFLAKMNLEGAVVGVACLTITIILGFLMAMQVNQPVLQDAKFIQVVVAWLLYSLLVAGHYAFGLSARAQVKFSLFNFVMFVGALVVVNSVFDTFHRFS